jgi:hypothetical protein
MEAPTVPEWKKILTLRPSQTGAASSPHQNQCDGMLPSAALKSGHSLMKRPSPCKERTICFDNWERPQLKNRGLFGFSGVIEKLQVLFERFGFAQK